MNTNNMKKMNLASLLISSAVGIAVGILLIFHADKMFGILAILLGIVGLVVSLPPFIDALLRNGEQGSAAGILRYGAAVLLSLALLISRNFVMMIIVGLSLIIIPVVRIARAENTGAQFRQELPRIIVGAVLVLVGPCRVVDWLFRVIGAAVLVLTVVYLIYGLLQYFGKIGKAESATKGTRTFADTTGDGKVDTIYVDTTGDGKTDTEMPFNKRQKK